MVMIEMTGTKYFDYYNFVHSKVVSICLNKNYFRLESWCASSAASQHSFGRQNTYNRTISNDSNANSIRSESDNYTNYQKDSQ